MACTYKCCRHRNDKNLHTNITGRFALVCRGNSHFAMEKLVRSNNFTSISYLGRKKWNLVCQSFWKPDIRHLKRIETTTTSKTFGSFGDYSTFYIKLKIAWNSSYRQNVRFFYWIIASNLTIVNHGWPNLTKILTKKVLNACLIPTTFQSRVLPIQHLFHFHLTSCLILLIGQNSMNVTICLLKIQELDDSKDG